MELEKEMMEMLENSMLKRNNTKLAKIDDAIMVHIGDILASVRDINNLMEKKKRIDSSPHQGDDHWKLEIIRKLNLSFDFESPGKSEYSASEIAEKIGLDTKRSTLLVISNYLRCKGFPQKRNSCKRYFCIDLKHTS